ncbi:unnamed protein product [Zymoseptoria tritici ST99CH_3D7]|uniref:Glycosyltransferase 2-like domain-containing protein n=1 Tax=Zymoseptoria tritici (strain ST99CH_3D7) TaxID=1276538 RepID=A0A1X7RXX9_ZYMT9|nr:unnamed protein product [Zymoseptoria tritici ST99CH_3D7]
MIQKTAMSNDYLQWSTRCVPAFSIGLVFVLLAYAFVVAPYGKAYNGDYTGEATSSQLILSIYTVLLHILSIVFPIRVCWSLRDVVKRMRNSAAIENPSTPRLEKQEFTMKGNETQLTFPSFPIILPAYKEEVSTLEETLRVLASHPQARQSYHVYLAMEEKEENSAVKAASLCRTFEASFLRISYTVHPANLPGEAQGKSSNEAWAAQQIVKDYGNDPTKKDVIVTTMDADTHLSARYFSQIARMHNDCVETKGSTIYVPPLVFDRNLHRVPLPVRTADLMWAGAGLSSLYTGSRVCIPTSVYSLPLTLIEHVGGWDTGPGAIGEDMHMYLKCFFALSGNLDVKVVYAAASQCNVSSDEAGLKGYYAGLEARYKQALRHMWGSLDSGYAIRESVKMFQRQRDISRKQIVAAATGVDPRLAEFANTAAKRQTSLLPPSTSASPHPYSKPIDTSNLLTLYHRLFEAHFLPTHLCVILTTSALYSFIHPSILVPRALNIALNISSYLRFVGYCTMLLYFHLYAQYHTLCVELRTEELRRTGLLEAMQASDGVTKGVYQIAGLVECMLFPLGGFVFGAIPALQAVVSHLFTERLVYVVSLKPRLPAALCGGGSGEVKEEVMEVKVRDAKVTEEKKRDSVVET